MKATTTEKALGWVIGMLLVALLVFGLYCGLAWLLATAWAAVAVPVFGWKALTFWQAFWLLVGFSVLTSFFRTGGQKSG